MPVIAVATLDQVYADPDTIAEQYWRLYTQSTVD